MDTNKEIEVKVTPHSHTMRFYKIKYRPKRKFNLFNFWHTLFKVWNGVYLAYDQPVLFRNFNDAVEFAQKLKADPKLIDKHYEEQDKRYKEAKERRKDIKKQKKGEIIIK